MNQTFCLKSSLRCGVFMLMLGAIAPAHAQSSVPDDGSRPILAPGRIGPQGAQGPKAANGPAMETTVANIMENPARLANRQVSVASVVGQVHSPWTFQLDEGSLTSGGIDNDLLVIGAEPLETMGFTPEWRGRRIIATGTVRMVQAEDFRRHYGRGTDDELFRRFEGKPALIATSLKLAQ